METKTMKVKMFFLEPAVPPRCRKARVRVNSEVCDMPVKAYTAEEAPVAFLVNGWQDKDEAVPYRLAGGKLYVKAKTNFMVNKTSDKTRAIFNANQIRIGDFVGDYGSWHQSSFEDLWNYSPQPVAKELPEFNFYHDDESRSCVKDRFRGEMGKLVMIDGSPWEEAKEPFYSVDSCRTNGEQHVHLNVRTGYDLAICAGMSNWRIYSLVEPVEDIEKKKMEEKKDGNPAFKYVWKGCPEKRVEVLIPEAVTLPTSNELHDIKQVATALKASDLAAKKLDIDIEGPMAARTAECRKQLADACEEIEGHLDRLLEQAFSRRRPGAVEPDREEHDGQIAEFKEKLVRYTCI